MGQKNKSDLQVTLIADITVVFSILFFMTQTLDSFNFPKQMVFSSGIFALACSILVYGKKIPSSKVTLTVAISILIISLVTILFSIPHNVFSQLTFWGEFSRANGLMSRIPLLIVVLIYTFYGRAHSIERFFKWMIALLVVEAMYGFIQLFDLDPIPWVNPYNNIFVTTGNPNFAAALYAVLVVLAFKFLFLENDLKIRLFAILCIVIGTYMSWATKSIQGILTIGAGIFLYIFIFFLRRFRKKKIRAIAGIALICAGAPIVSGILNIGPLKSILFQETLAIRMHYWRVALSIIRDYPIFGVGIDRYGDFFRYYREQNFVEKYTPGVISTNAHNVALQWGSDLGILGIVAYLSLFLLASYFYLQNSNFNSQKNITRLDILYVSFFAFFLQSLISIAQLSITILGFAILGNLFSEVKLHQNSPQLKDSELLTSSWSRKTSFVGLGTWWLVFMVILLPLTSTFVRADLNLRSAIQMPGQTQGIQDLSIRSEEIKKSVSPLMADQDYVSIAIQNLFSQGDAKVGIEIAKDSFIVNPRSWVSLQSQALAFAQSNLNDEAIEVTNEALKIDPRNYNLVANLADLYLKSGNRVQAKVKAKEAALLAPFGTDAYNLAKQILIEVG